MKKSIMEIVVYFIYFIRVQLLLFLIRTNMMIYYKLYFLQVEVSSDEFSSSYPPRHGALVKPLSATKSTLREQQTPDIVRLRDLPQGGSSSMPVKNPPNLEPVFSSVLGSSRQEPVPSISLGSSNRQHDSGKGSIGSELERFYSESKGLREELNSITTAFPGAVLEKELSPRDSRYYYYNKLFRKYQYM